MWIDDANEGRDQVEDKVEVDKSDGRSNGNEDVKEVHLVVPNKERAPVQTPTLQISFQS